jgi:hypothetical protein
MDAAERIRAELARYRADPDHGGDGLASAVRELGELCKARPSDPDVTHLLMEGLLLLDDRPAVIELLRGYADGAPSLDEEFWARHNLVDQCSIACRWAEALAAHGAMIGRLRGQVPAERLLWSLADGTMLESWQREGAQADWLALAESLYAELPDAPEILPTRVQCLQLLNDAIAVPQGDWDAARRTARRLLDVAAAHPAWDQGLMRSAEAYGTLMEVAHAELEAALQGGRRTLQAYGERVRRGEGTPGFRRNLDHALHNFACMCIWSGQLPEAVFWFRRLLAVGQPSAWSHVFFAECLAAQGDVHGAMEHVRAAVADPDFGGDVRGLPDRDGLQPLRGRSDFLELIRARQEELAGLRAAAGL